MDNLHGPFGLPMIGVAASILIYLASRRPSDSPPGPRRWPLIGNLLQMPQKYPWLTFFEWSKIYGSIIQVDVLGQPIVIINSHQLAKELLDKKSSIYSDRPHLTMAGELAGYNQAFVLKHYGDDWRNQRKLITHDFSQSMMPRYYSLQEREARILVKEVLKDSNSLFSQVKFHIGIIIMRVTYGYYIQDEQDPFLQMAFKTMANFSKASLPGNFMVDFIPALKNLPQWLPGTGFLKIAVEMQKVLTDATWQPYFWARSNLETGKTLLPSLCGSMLQDAGGELSKETEDALACAAGTVMGGGLDTNASTALSFLLAMLLHPNIQRRAQAEIDAVVGNDRLPKISDRESLPYIRSIITEVLRWKPVGPLGVPHAMTQDDFHNGLLLRKGTVVIVNIWQMLQDPTVYPNPSAFNPDRFAKDDSEMQKVADVVFGFGRRACPGYHFAMGTLYSIVLTVLSTCDVLPALDEQGMEIMPDVAYSSGTISFPERFPLRLRPRSQKAAALLNEVVAGAE